MKPGPKQNLGKGWIERGYRCMMFNGRQVREHRHIWENNYGKIPKGYQIHHINGDKLDNRIENLKLMKTGEHTKLHNNGFKKGNQLYKKRKMTRGNPKRDKNTGRFIHF